MEVKHDIVLRLVKLMNALLMGISVAFFTINSFLASFNFNKSSCRECYLVVFLFLILYYLFGRIYDAFWISFNRLPEMIYSQMLAAILSDGIVYIVVWFLLNRRPGLMLMLMCAGIQFLISALWSVAAKAWYFYVFPAKKTAIIYNTHDELQSLIEYYGLTKKFGITENCSIQECIESDFSQIRDNDIEVVCMRDVQSHDRNQILKYCIKHKITVYVVPRVGDMLMKGAEDLHMLHLPIVRLTRYKPSVEYAFAKRLFDILFSGIALLVSSPVMLLTAIAIKLYDGGSVIYKQTRLTKDGRQFKILKFRSMHENAEKECGAITSPKEDKRTTAVGKVIRRFRIDELPQFINIFVGDMSIVGPRPERPELAEKFEKEMPEFALRLQVKAGLTGYAQVYGKYNTSPYDKLQMDLYYISNQSILHDLTICLATVKILFMAESTEGVEPCATSQTMNVEVIMPEDSEKEVYQTDKAEKTVEK